MDRYILGIDAGTSATKAVLFDRDLNEIAASALPTTLLTPQPGHVETDMDATWERVTSVIRNVLEQSGVKNQQVMAVGVTAQMVGLWPVDAAGKPTRNAILHTDSRTLPLYEAFEAAHPNFLQTVFRSSGSAMQPGCTLPLLRWLADHEPEVLSKTRWVLGCKGWILSRLTNTYQLDPSEVTVLPGDTQHRDYAASMFDLMDITAFRERFPTVKASTEVVGQITAHAAEQTGLMAGTPVVAGAGDVVATAIGLGAVEPGTAYTILGTTCLSGLILPQPSFEPDGIGLTFCQPESTWIRVMFNVLGTPNLDWFIQQAFQDVIQETTSSQTLFDHIEAMAQEIETGAAGVIFLPYLSPSGVFTPFVEYGARAEFFGLSVEHDRRHMLRAVYEGVVLSIRDAFEALDQPIDQIRLGGGGARSRLWPQLLADFTGKPVLIPKGTEFGARGAAFLASVGLGWYDDVQAIRQIETIQDIYEPNTSAAHDHLFSVYQALAQALRPVWQRMDDGNR